MTDGDLSPPGDRRDELQTRRALEGLDAAEAAELRALGGDDDDDLDALVGALDVALARSAGEEALPPALAARIAAEAPAHLPTNPAVTVPPVRFRLAAWSGWAAALATAAALAGVLARPPERVEVRVEVPVEVPVEAPPKPEPSPEERLAALGGQAPSAPLAAGTSPLARGASGRVFWGGPGQAGFLKVEGLAEVDPVKGVYQLWIFDRRRDERYPVDGGTFLVKGTGPTVVPIRPAVDVAEPTLFAVTLEPPGGVVVSDRKRIMLAGAWPG